MRRPARYALYGCGSPNSDENLFSDSQLRGFLSRRARTLYFFALIRRFLLASTRIEQLIAGFQPKS